MFCTGYSGSYFNYIFKYIFIVFDKRRKRSNACKCFIMVDRSARLIAAYTGEKGGTKNTVDYAARKGVQTVFVL